MAARVCRSRPAIFRSRHFAVTRVEFEKAFAEYVGARNAVAVGSCTAGFQLTLHALGIGAGWLQAEYRAASIPFDRPGVRIERLEETMVVVLNRLWFRE